MMKNEQINKKDKKSVSEWLNTTIDNLKTENIIENFSAFKQQAKEMYDSYDEFPEDAKRTNKILNLLKLGEECLPIYVAKDDIHNFVMEGRHRLVAFYLLNMEQITVCRVSLIEENKNKNKNKI